MKYSIGFDIGIASVGWSVISAETGKIIDLGVRLFSSRNSDENKTRRDSRGTRRLYNRRRTRLKEAKKLLNDYGFYFDPTIANESPYEMRVRGLHEKLTPGEIFKATTHIVKKRGISYLDEEDSTGSGADSQTYKAQVNNNLKALKEKTPGQIQLDRLNNHGRVKTGETFEDGYQLNVFTVRAYADELERILKQQQNYYPEITDEFIQKFVSKGYREGAGLIYRKRPYYDGPGNKDNNSKYGRWAEYEKDGKPAENIFDQLIGTDILGETRASNSSYTAQVYNLLNDLNNLTIARDNPKFTTEEKQALIDHLFETKPGAFGPKKVLKFFDLDEADVKGWRVDNKDKPEIHSLGVYRYWKQIFAEEGIDLADVAVEDIDAIASVITLNSEMPAALITLKLEVPHLDDEIIKVIENRFHDFKKRASSKSWHSFSLTTLNKIIPELLHTSEEQNTVLERLNLKFDLRNKYSNKKRLPVNDVLAEIYNPTVSKSVRQTIHVFNELMDKYGKENIAYVTIEMPRDKNEKDQKDTISKIQKLNAKRKDNSNDYFLTKSGWNQDQFEKALSSPKFASKLLHYYIQDGKCAYTQTPIQPEELLTNACEIDHIIPLSISLDDSIHNKVLVTASANQEKGQQSPYMAFNSGAIFGQTWDEYVTWVKSRKFHKTKERNLLEQRNIFSPEMREGFISRNLNDTRYASRVFLNAVQSFFYKQDNHTKIKVINGSFTHTLRKKWGTALEKNRETHHHHAVDATLCAVSPFIHIVNYEYFEDENGKKMMADGLTGEVISYRDYKEMSYYDRKSYAPIWGNFIEQLSPSKLYDKIKFSHQVDKKWNRKISDATLYSTRQVTTEKINKKGQVTTTTEDYVIAKIKDIYTPEGWKEFKKQQDKLLMKTHDEQTYDKLLEIAEEYNAKKDELLADGTVKTKDISPFKLYCEIQGVPAIRKHSKKGNGPYIKSVKYYDKGLGKHINITKNNHGESVEKTSRNKKVILKQQNPWRTDVYYDSENDRYCLLGLKYNHLKFIGKEYGIPTSVYEQLKVEDGIEKQYDFMFSLYKNDRISITYGNETIEGLYSSKNDSNKNYFEMKPLEKNKWDKREPIKVFGNIAASGQFIKGIKPGMVIKKINVSYTGDRYFVESEELKNIIED